MVENNSIKVNFKARAEQVNTETTSTDVHGIRRMLINGKWKRFKKKKPFQKKNTHTRKDFGSENKILEMC